MKPKIFIPAVSLILFITLLNIHCNKDDDNSDFFIPTIDAATWANQNNSSNTFFFLVDSTNSNSSTFTGNENLPAGGQDHFTGSFTNHAIRFTYDAGSSNNKSGKTFIGTINNASTLMTLQNNDLGSLVLQKQ
jgi:hypothetical protein